MKKFFAEFKEFVMRGNVLDLAVAVIIGGAFQSIVSSLCDDVITPLIQLIISKTIQFGNFISAVINFLIMAVIIFILVKGVNGLLNIRKKEETEEEAATTKVCPFCKSEISIEATRCPHCTSQLEEAEAK